MSSAINNENKVLNLNEYAASKNATLNYRVVSPGKKAIASLALILGTIVAVGGILALLSHYNIITTSHLGMLGTINFKAAVAMTASGGALLLTGIVIGSVLYHKFRGVKKLCNQIGNFADLKAKLNNVNFAYLELATTTGGIQKGHYALAFRPSDFLIYFYTTKKNENKIEIVETNSIGHKKLKSELAFYRYVDLET